MFGAIVGAGLSLFGANEAADQASRDRRLQRQAAERLASVEYNPFSTMFQGAGVEFGDGTANLQLGGFASPYDAFNQLFSQGAAGAQRLTQQGEGLMGQIDPSMLASLTGQAFGQAGGLGQTGFQRGLQDILFSQAGQMAGQTDFSGLRDETLATLRAQAQPFEERAFAGLQENLFGTGRLGSSGGALQTEAFARGLGQADLSRQLQATDVAQRQQMQQANIANLFSGAGMGLGSLEDQLLSSAYGRFGTTAGLTSDLATRTFGMGQGLFGQATGAQAAQQGILQSILGLGTFGANLGATQASTDLAAAGGNVSAINQLGPTGGDIWGQFATTMGSNLMGDSNLSDAFGSLFRRDTPPPAPPVVPGRGG